MDVVGPEYFKDKIVLVGETDFKAKDIFTTPFGDMAGVQVHANIVATLLSRRGPPAIAPLWQTALVAFACSALLIVPLLRLSLWSSLLVAIGQIILVVLGVIALFRLRHQVMPASVPITAMVLTYNGIALYEYGRARATLGRFVGREMLGQTFGIFSRLRPGGRVAEATAFLCDLRELH